MSFRHPPSVPDTVHLDNFAHTLLQSSNDNEAASAGTRQLYAKLEYEDPTGSASASSGGASFGNRDPHSPPDGEFILHLQFGDSFTHDRNQPASHWRQATRRALAHATLEHLATKCKFKYDYLRTSDAQSVYASILTALAKTVHESVEADVQAHSASLVAFASAPWGDEVTNFVRRKLAEKEFISTAPTMMRIEEIKTEGPDIGPIAGPNRIQEIKTEGENDGDESIEAVVIPEARVESVDHLDAETNTPVFSVSYENTEDRLTHNDDWTSFNIKLDGDMAKTLKVTFVPRPGPPIWDGISGDEMGVPIFPPSFPPGNETATVPWGAPAGWPSMNRPPSLPFQHQQPFIPPPSVLPTYNSHHSPSIPISYAYQMSPPPSEIPASFPTVTLSISPSSPPNTAPSVHPFLQEHIISEALMRAASMSGWGSYPQVVPQPSSWFLPGPGQHSASMVPGYLPPHAVSSVAGVPGGPTGLVPYQPWGSRIAQSGPVCPSSP